MVKRKRVRPDAVMIMTSGKLGECGELQAYFDKMGVPFTFSGVEETKVLNITNYAYKIKQMYLCSSFVPVESLMSFPITTK